MNEFKKKQELEDLLVVHKPAGQEKNKADRNAADKGKGEAKGLFEFKQLKKRLLSTDDMKEQETILGLIQARFGNDAAGRAMDELKAQKKEHGASNGKRKKL